MFASPVYPCLQFKLWFAGGSARFLFSSKKNLYRMSFQHKVLKPRTQRGKRFLKNREPKLFEDTKALLAVRTSTASELVVKILKDLSALKKPDSTFLGRKHDLRPFEHSEVLDTLSSKYDCTLLLTGSHNKKRPACVTFARTFDHHVLDMYEFCVENFKGIADFPGLSPPLGNKPLLVFRGDSFEHDPVHQKIKNIFTDYFRGPTIDKIRPGGLTHCIVFVSTGGKILMRTYLINGASEYEDVKSSESTLTPTGPSMDLLPRRSKLASDDLWKNACRVPKEATIKKRKNVSQDVFGSKLGRIHMESQDFTRLNVKKMKGLRPDTAPPKEAEVAPTESKRSEYSDIGGDVD